VRSARRPGVSAARQIGGDERDTRIRLFYGTCDFSCLYL
jgi:hypothetical protein